MMTRFVRFDDLTIKDTKTNTIWLAQNLGRMTYKRALMMCDQMSKQEEDKKYIWKLPSEQQLHELLKDMKDEKIREGVFPDVFNGPYWTDKSQDTNHLIAFAYDSKTRTIHKKEKIFIIICSSNKS